MKKLCVKLQMMAPDVGLSQICSLSMSITGYELFNLISFKEFHCVNMFTCLFILEKKFIFQIHYSLFLGPMVYGHQEGRSYHTWRHLEL